MGLFDSWTAGGSGNSKEALDEEWEKQQEILRNRRKPKSERDAYFKQVERKRQEASKKQSDMWSWQTKTYKKGEDPIDEWKKRRESGDISDLDNQYGDPKKIGGIPLPMPSVREHLRCARYYVVLSHSLFHSLELAESLEWEANLTMVVGLT